MSTIGANIYIFMQIPKMVIFFLVGLPYLLIHWGVGAGVLYIYKKWYMDDVGI